MNCLRDLGAPVIFLYLGLQSLMDMEKEGLSGAPTETALPRTEGHLLPPNCPCVCQGRLAVCAGCSPLIVLSTNGHGGHKQAWALPEQLWRLGTVAVAIFIHELASQ